MHYRPDRLKVMPGKIVDKLPTEDRRATPTTSRSPTPGRRLRPHPPQEVEQLLSTLAR